MFEVISGFNSELSSKLFNDKFDYMIGGNYILEGFDVDYASDTSVMVSGGLCIVQGAFIKENEETIEMSIPKELLSSKNIYLFLKYEHEKSILEYVLSNSSKCENAVTVSNIVLDNGIIAEIYSPEKLTQLGGISSLLISKADKDNVYTKQETYSSKEIDNALDDKISAINTYTKAEIDIKIDNIIAGGPGNNIAYSEIVSVSDWVSDNGIYYVDITHDLNTNRVMTTVVDNDTNISITAEYKIITNDVIRISYAKAINAVVTIINGNVETNIISAQIDDANITTRRTWSSDKISKELKKVSPADHTHKTSDIIGFDSHGNHVPSFEEADNRRFLRNDGAWATIPSASTSEAGIVQLSGDTNNSSELTAATSNAIKKVNDIVSGKANIEHGNHVPSFEEADNRRFLRNDGAWATIPNASTSETGIVQLNNAVTSSSITTAATSNAVKQAYDLANSKANASHGNHVPTPEAANNYKFLRNDNTWASIPNANTSQAGVVQLSTSVTNTSTTIAAASSAVKAVYDLVTEKANTNHGNHVPSFETVDSRRFLRNDGIWATIPSASINEPGIVQLNNTTTSTSATHAATANAVKQAYDLANSKANASHGNHVPSLESANSYKFLRNDGTWAIIPNASTSVKGVVQLSSSTTSTSITTAATSSAVKAAMDVAKKVVLPVGKPSSVTTGTMWIE